MHTVDMVNVLTDDRWRDNDINEKIDKNLTQNKIKLNPTKKIKFYLKELNSNWKSCRLNTATSTMDTLNMFTVDNWTFLHYVN